LKHRYAQVIIVIGVLGFLGVAPAAAQTTDRKSLDEVNKALSPLGSGQGVVVFYGMAKPVRTPLIGPPRQP
jgi:hypothetical protein